MNGIQIGVDSTDHVAFFCPTCNSAMRVEGVDTKNVIVNSKTKAKDKCTFIWLRCKKCKDMTGARKFYWTIETGEYCEDRTDALDSSHAHN